jgi:glycosyltransferase involved in cell wall biosynthesis
MKLKLAIVVPVYNEEAVLIFFFERLQRVLAGLTEIEATIVFVLDGCTDDSLNILQLLTNTDPRLKILVLSRQFGHQVALLAGIENSLDSDIIVTLDADLQHPPELIPELIAGYRNGYDVVYTIRNETKNISYLKKITSQLFYQFLAGISNISIKANVADFRLISNRVAKIISSDIKEKNLFIRGIIPWIGFAQLGIEYRAEDRAAGQSKYTITKMLRLALAGILSFSTKPLQIAIFIGLGFSALAFLLIVATIIKYFIVQTLPDGWTTLVVLLLLFSGIQLIGLGILGLYIGAIYQEVKNRPRYLIEKIITGLKS